MRKKMSRAFVYSVLAILLIAVHSTIAFSSNIHEKMTRTERMAVFGSEDVVPEYQVFSMSLPGARRRRETNEALKLRVQLHNKEVNLSLKPTAGYLATKYTPVWLAYTDKHAYQNIRYDPLPTAMRNVGEFKMYHDVENDAALVTYTDPTEEIVIEGIVTPYYAIRSLPKRLMGEPLTEGRQIHRHIDAKKRSITSDAKVDTGHFAVFKVPAASNHVKRSALAHPANRQAEKRARGTGKKQKVPKTVYPEILVVLDYDAIRNQTITQALRFILAFWNGADLIYRSFHNPKVRLNIAGIIIAADDWATPYITLNASAKICPDKYRIVSEMGKYFYNEKIRFPINGYDMIIGMTSMCICPNHVSNRCFALYKHANPHTTCLSTREISRRKTIANNGIIGYHWHFTGIIAAAATTAYIFGAETEDTNDECPLTDGHVMSKWTIFSLRTFKWSKCSRRFFSQYFSSTKSKCLDNKPRWRNTVGKVLPGRWMSMDGQCQNEGFAKACKLKKKSMCAAKSCQRKNSVKCIRTGRAALPGSTCARNKHCSTKKQCVPN